MKTKYLLNTIITTIIFIVIFNFILKYDNINLSMFAFSIATLGFFTATYISNVLFTKEV